MNTFDAVMIAEGAQEADSEEQYLEAWQHLVDTGTCWGLQGVVRENRSVTDRGGPHRAC